jgi:hypothetical protein
MLFRHQVIEHDAAKPWLIVSTRRGLSLDATSAEEFREKAQNEILRCIEVTTQMQGSDGSLTAEHRITKVVAHIVPPQQHRFSEDDSVDE